MTSNQDLALSPNQDLSSNQALNQDLTPNQINDISTRLCKAKKFLQKNPKERKITATHIFNLSESTLQSSILRPQNSRHDGHNQVLQQYQKKALHVFI